MRLPLSDFGYAAAAWLAVHANGVTYATAIAMPPHDSNAREGFSPPGPHQSACMQPRDVGSHGFRKD